MQPRVRGGLRRPTQNLSDDQDIQIETKKPAYRGPEELDLEEDLDEIRELGEGGQVRLPSRGFSDIPLNR